MYTKYHVCMTRASSGFWTWRSALPLSLSLKEENALLTTHKTVGTLHGVTWKNRRGSIPCLTQTPNASCVWSLAIARLLAFVPACCRIEHIYTCDLHNYPINRLNAFKNMWPSSPPQTPPHLPTHLAVPFFFFITHRLSKSRRWRRAKKNEITPSVSWASK